MFKQLKYRILVAGLLTSAIGFAKQDVNEQYMKVIMREVGHNILMQMGDSVSRVLPITKEENRYRIQFEKYLAFEPDLLLISADEIFKSNKLNTSYILEVEQCSTHEVVYSYAYDPEEMDGMVACKSRPLPQDCYAFYFTLTDENAVVVPVKEEEPFNRLYLLPFGMLALVLIVVFRKKKKGKASKEHIMQIGNYEFDVHRMKLCLNGVEEELSSKESDLLELLATNPNQTLERDYILKVVWKDEGDYVGRTLDVSISKLRKKLSADPRIEIINSRGVGYRFTIEV